MWELIKKDPVLKAITIFVIGIFAFAFAFSIMFGTGQTGMEEGPTGYTAATGFGNIIVMLAKMLIIIILIAIIITTVKFIKKHVIGNEPVRGLDKFKNKPLALPLVGIGGILLLLLTINLLPLSSSGNEMAHTAASTTINQAGTSMGITGILYFLLKFVAAVSVIALVISLAMYFKNRYFDNTSASSLEGNDLCQACENELKASWKCCPICGIEKMKNETKVPIAEDRGKN